MPISGRHSAADVRRPMSGGRTARGGASPVRGESMVRPGENLDSLHSWWMDERRKV